MERRYAGCGQLAPERLKELKALREANKVCEKPLLEIRPLVREDELAFHVKYQPLDDFIREQKLDHYLLITTAGAYKAVLDKLSGTYTVIYVTDSKDETLKDLQALYDDTVAQQATDPTLDPSHRQAPLCISDIPFEAVLCLGGGVSMDAGKYLAERVVHAPLYAVPSALSVNAAFCYKAAIRERDPYNHDAFNVVYKFYGLPQAICIDLDVITGAGPLATATGQVPVSDEERASAVKLWNMLRELNVAGAGDLLSILTATFDWQINSLVARGMTAPDPADKDALVKLEKPFSQEVCNGAMELLSLLSEYADRIRSGSREGAEFLARAYHWIAEQSWLMQHTMWESASEHGMFDCFENVAGTELTHGQVVALSVFFMSRLQENQHHRAIELIHRLGIDISLTYLAADKRKNGMIAPITLYRCLEELKQYIDQIAYRYTIISAKPITKQWILDALDAYYAEIYETMLADHAHRASLFSGDDPLSRSERQHLELVHDRLQADLNLHRAAMAAATTAAQAEQAKLQDELSAPTLTAQRNAELQERILQARADAYKHCLEAHIAG